MMFRYSDSTAPTLTLSNQKFLLICLIYSSVLFCSHSYTACVFFYGMMIDSSLIYMTELFPADAAKSFAVHVEEEVHGALVREQCCVSPNLTSWCHNLSISLPGRMMCCLYFRSISYRKWKSEVHLSFNSPSIITHLFIYSQRESACLFVCSATDTASFLFLFSAFQSLAEEMLFTHMSDVLHLSQPAWQPFTIIK